MGGTLKDDVSGAWILDKIVDRRTLLVRENRCRGNGTLITIQFIEAPSARFIYPARARRLRGKAILDQTCRAPAQHAKSAFVVVRHTSNGESAQMPGRTSASKRLSHRLARGRSRANSSRGKPRLLCADTACCRIKMAAKFR